jgi:hypothetical protein
MFSGARQRPRSESGTGWERRAAIIVDNGPLIDLRWIFLVDQCGFPLRSSAAGHFAERITPSSAALATTEGRSPDGTQFKQKG